MATQTGSVTYEQYRALPDSPRAPRAGRGGPLPQDARLRPAAQAVHYARAGVHELWLVDAEAPAAKVYRLVGADAAGFSLVEELGQEGELATPLLPGFSVRLDARRQP